jgi:hypothetical protein
MGEAKRRRQAAGGSGNEPPGPYGGIKIDGHLLTRIAALSHPHVEAIFKALIAAFPGNNEYPVLLYAPALACQLGVILHIAGTDQKHAVEDINKILTATADDKNNYRLIALAQCTDDGDLGTMTVDERLWKRIVEVSKPHMDALQKAIAAAFPGNTTLNMYEIALACELSRLLNPLSSIDRSHAVNVINMTLTAAGCMLRSDQALERILDQRDRDLFDRGGVPGVVLKLISNADTRKAMDAGGIARHLFPDSPAIEQAALSGIIHRSLEVWSTEAPEYPTRH